MVTGIFEEALEWDVHSFGQASTWGSKRMGAGTVFDPEVPGSSMEYLTK